MYWYLRKVLVSCSLQAYVQIEYNMSKNNWKLKVKVFKIMHDSLSKKGFSCYCHKHFVMIKYAWLLIDAEPMVSRNDVDHFCAR